MEVSVLANIHTMLSHHILHENYSSAEMLLRGILISLFITELHEVHRYEYPYCVATMHSTLKTFSVNYVLVEMLSQEIIWWSL
jgi:hypothetical protein